MKKMSRDAKAVKSTKSSAPPAPQTYRRFIRDARSMTQSSGRLFWSRIWLNPR